MKKSVFFLMAVVAVFTHETALAQSAKTETFKVYGNCGMCKKRIEKAIASEGITKVDWNADTKIMTVTYDSTKTSNDTIQKKIASAGHDTDKYTADENVYNKLPGCCLYDRKKADKQTDHSGHRH